MADVEIEIPSVIPPEIIKAKGQRSRSDAKSRFFWRIIVVVVLLGVGLMNYLFLVDLNKPYDPLWTSTPQAVTNRVVGVDGPAVHLGQSVDAIGTKCNMSHRQVSLTARTTWIETSPPGTAVVLAVTSNIREPGCFVKHFSDTVPLEVTARSAALLKANPEAIVSWKITGEVTPLGGHHHTISRVWQTQVFRIVK